MTSEIGRLSKQIIRLKYILIYLKAVLDMMIVWWRDSYLAKHLRL